MKETKRNGTIKTLKIDGQDFSARQDDTILEVARENNIFIPTLCDLKGLSTVGACRLCLVELKGSSRLFPACVTRVEEGMEVTTQSERLDKYRRAILELLFTERNHICSVCFQRALRNAEPRAKTPDYPRAFSVPLSQREGGRFSRALRGGSQSLHSVQSVRSGMR